MKKKRASSKPFKILFVLCMVFSVLLSFSIPAFADDGISIPFSDVILSSSSIKRFCDTISFDCDNYLVGYSFPMHNVRQASGDSTIITSDTPATDEHPIIYNFGANYSTRHNRFNFYGFCPKDSSYTTFIDYFTFQPNIHYILTFDLEVQFQGDEFQPNNLYFAFYDLSVDSSMTPTGKQLHARLYEASKVSPITPTRNRYVFDFSFTSDELTKNNCYAFGVVTSDTSTQVSTRSGYVYYYNWNTQCLDDAKYLIYRLKNPDVSMSKSVSEAAELDKALENTRENLQDSVDASIDDIGVFGPDNIETLQKAFENSGPFIRSWLNDLYNKTFFIWFPIDVALFFGLFKFLVG